MHCEYRGGILHTTILSHTTFRWYMLAALCAPNIVSVKWELAATPRWLQSSETVQESCAPFIGKQISPNPSRNDLWQKSPPDLRALLDLLNKQTFDRNLWAYTDADLQCKWSWSPDTSGENAAALRQQQRESPRITLPYPQLDLCQPSLMEALSLLAFRLLKQTGTCSGGPSRRRTAV